MNTLSGYQFCRGSRAYNKSCQKPVEGLCTMPQIGGPIQTSVHSGTLLLAVQDKEKLSGGKVIITNILIESFFSCVFIFIKQNTTPTSDTHHHLYCGITVCYTKHSSTLILYFCFQTIWGHLLEKNVSLFRNSCAFLSFTFTNTYFDACLKCSICLWVL